MAMYMKWRKSSSAQDVSQFPYPIIKQSRQQYLMLPTLPLASHQLTQPLHSPRHHLLQVLARSLALQHACLFYQTLSHLLGWCTRSKRGQHCRHLGIIFPNICQPHRKILPIIALSLRLLQSTRSIVNFLCVQLLTPPDSQLTLYLLGDLALGGGEHWIFIGDLLSKFRLGGGEELFIVAAALLDGHAEGGQLAALAGLLHSYRNQQQILLVITS